MRLPLRLDAWCIDTNYFLTGVTINAVDPEDVSGKAYLFSTLAFTDKRRVGRMPGGGRARKGNGGGSGGGGGSGDGREGSTSGGGKHEGTGGGHDGCGCPVDMTELLFDGFDRTAASDLGDVPVPDDAAAWWPGGNPWGVGPIDEVTGMDSWGTDGTSAYFVSSTPDALYYQSVSTADGDLPMEVDAWEVLIRWRLTTAATVTALEQHYAAFSWRSAAGPDELFLHFGDDVFDEGIRLSGATQPHVPKVLPVDEWALLRWQYDGVDERARVWAEADDEPTTWDTEVAVLVGPHVLPTYLGMYGRIGNASGPAQRIDIESIRVMLPAQSGELLRKSIPHGSGGIIDVGEAYEPGTLSVTVDDNDETPDSFDPDAGTADMGAALYHDPSNHPAGCAQVRVVYRKQ